MIRVFLDASVLFSAAYSKTGAAREILRLGIRGHVEIVVSDYVLEETRRNLAAKAPAALPSFEQLLDATDFNRANPTRRQVERAAEYTEIKDAPVVAAAIKARATHLTSHDSAHLVGDPAVTEGSGLLIVTPGELLATIREGAE